VLSGEFLTVQSLGLNDGCGAGLRLIVAFGLYDRYREPIGWRHGRRIFFRRKRDRTDLSTRSSGRGDDVCSRSRD
jgi:hypothetical protein